MVDQDQVELWMLVVKFRQEYEDYDVVINVMIIVGCDVLCIQWMKKKKLVIKDVLIKIEDQIILDIIV